MLTAGRLQRSLRLYAVNPFPAASLDSATPAFSPFPPGQFNIKKFILFESRSEYALLKLETSLYYLLLFKLSLFDKKTELTN